MCEVNMRNPTMGMVLAAAILAGTQTYKFNAGRKVVEAPISKLEKRLKAKAKRDRKNTGSGVAKTKRAKRKAKNK